MQNDMIFWVWLAEQLGPKSRDFCRLITHYETAYDLFHLEESELDRIEGLMPRTRTRLADKDLSHASEIVADCERKGIGILPYGDMAYPRLLRDLQEPPIVLYYSGTLPDFNERLCIAMVGTRDMSEYGLCTAYRIAYELASVGTLVVSGMAAGIDGVSAAAAMQAGGDTVAVLGCGVDMLYPRHHGILRDEIRAHGVLLSEYAPGVRPNYYHFPTRNRIISGLCQGTLVVEAGLKSGTLITAKDAIMQGRDIFAVPANVNNPKAQGTNGLLRDGANLVLETEDVLRHYSLYESLIDLGALETAHTRSRTDMRALARYGVIELVKPSALQADAVPRETYTAPAPKREAKKTERRASTEPKPTRRTAEQPPLPSPTLRMSSEPSTIPPSRDAGELIRKLSPIQLAVLQATPNDRPVGTDELNRLDYPCGDIMAALTMLEILGYIRKLPGALYIKA